MKQRTLQLMEEAISSAGKWVWFELANDSFQIEFEDVQLYKPSSRNKKHSSELAIRLADNGFFSLFYNEIEDINFLSAEGYIYDDFSFNLLSDGLKFQDFEFSKKTANSYIYEKSLIGKPFEDILEGECDFLLTIRFDKIAIVCGANQLHFFNEFESLNDEDIKRLSNQWCVYWLDYWKSKETDKYEYDPACEVFPFYI